ncbi:MAG: IS5 family transposase [Myxococcales bacterium]|nr:IS5 family transposase [Myxococcales bacterium]
MRGSSPKQSSMLCLVSVEDRVPQDHPLRPLKKMADRVLEELSPVFDAMYAEGGRPSVPPERLLKALLLQALFTIRSERQLCEQLQYNLLYRWFLDMDMVEDAFAPTVFTKNRERLLAHEVAAQFFDAVVNQAQEADLMSSEHFSVDGTMIEAWASMKSFRPKDDDDDDNNGWADFRGKKRSNETHESKTDPEARLWRKGKGKEAKLCFGGNALMENRNGLLVDFRVDVMSGRVEREAALELLDANVECRPGVTAGGDRGYDTKEFVAELRARGVTPHVAQNITRHRGSAIDGRTTRHDGYTLSQTIRKRIEEIFGWFKTVGGLRRTRFRGVERTQMAAHIVGAAYNLLRISRLMAAA